MEFSEAIVIAESLVKSISNEIGFDLTIIKDQTLEGVLGWIFFYNTMEYALHRHPSDALAGNGPILVFRDGRVEELPSSSSLEEAYTKIKFENH